MASPLLRAPGIAGEAVRPPRCRPPAAGPERGGRATGSPRAADGASWGRNPNRSRLLGRGSLAPALLALPNQIREPTERDLQAIGQGPIQENGGRDLGPEHLERHVRLVLPRCVQAADEGKLD